MTATLDGRVVLVTGAGGGVGRGIALACGAVGASVVVSARGESGTETADDITRRGGEAIAVRCDVTDRADVDRTLDAAVAAYGRVDAVFHNATSRASSQPHLLEDADLALWEEHASVSLRGSFHCAQAAHPHLVRSQGSLILLTSPAGIEGSESLPFYSVVKASQRGFTKSLALEWGPDGVRVNAIAPLAVTDALHRAFEADPTLEPSLRAKIPLGRLGDSEDDIGTVAAFLASDGASYMTGQTLIVSGGRFTLL